MTDVVRRPGTLRTALASGRVLLGEDAFRQVQSGTLAKGDAITTAQIAGILGGKQTSRLLPLCHDVALKGIDLELTLDEDDFALDIRAFVKTFGQTGVEMEALTAVSVAALTVYDMVKSVSKGVRITDVHLIAKTGGQSGDYRIKR
jgi:molybdenum cofactor biosynthesis protein MoaC